MALVCISLTSKKKSVGQHINATIGCKATHSIR